MSDSDPALWSPVDPFAADLKGRCPRCGEGGLFAGLLNMAQGCRVCRLEYDFADAGDGRVVFVILLIGFLIVGLALWLDIAYAPPLWLHFVLWIPLTIMLGLVALRLIKGVMIRLQYRNKAAEGRLHKGE